MNSGKLSAATEAASPIPCSTPESCEAQPPAISSSPSLQDTDTDKEYLLSTRDASSLQPFGYGVASNVEKLHVIKHGASGADQGPTPRNSDSESTVKPTRPLCASKTSEAAETPRGSESASKQHATDTENSQLLTDLFKKIDELSLSFESRMTEINCTLARSQSRIESLVVAQGLGTLGDHSEAGLLATPVTAPVPEPCNQTTEPVTKSTQ